VCNSNEKINIDDSQIACNFSDARSRKWTNSREFLTHKCIPSMEKRGAMERGKRERKREENRSWGRLKCKEDGEGGGRERVMEGGKGGSDREGNNE
jgi:hypothetical protein